MWKQTAWFSLEYVLTGVFYDLLIVVLISLFHVDANRKQNKVIIYDIEI